MPALPGAGWPEYVCPRCKGALELAPEAYVCGRCGRYPVVLGIPDFRVFPDPYIGIEDDRKKGARLAERAGSTDFVGLLRFYWEITPDTPKDLAARYVRNDSVGVARGRQMLREIDSELPGLGKAPGRRVLELGCRSGGFLAAAAERSDWVVGIDIAFRWLVVARKQLEERGLTARLACACAQHLPFRDASFDLAVAGNVIEHTSDQTGLVAESHRALRPGGAFFAVTCNRLSLGPEPHVSVWGVGFLPRRFMSSYVRWVRGSPYQHLRLVSSFELWRLLKRTPFRNGRLGLAALGAEEREGLPIHERLLLGAFERVRSWRILRPLLLVFGPLLQLVCVREEKGHTA